MRPDCACTVGVHQPSFVVLTGGPSAGKTAALEVIRRSFCRHIAVLPEAASIVFGGGFPRTEATRRASQRAIFHVQVELERAARDAGEAALALCDRGVLDGLAYWPDTPESFFSELRSSRAELLARYAAVIHLRTPPLGAGYDRSNPLRVETAEQAARLDERILSIWSGHPRLTVIENAETFVAKLERVVEAVKRDVPPCCRSHPIGPAPG